MWNSSKLSLVQLTIAGRTTVITGQYICTDNRNKNNVLRTLTWYVCASQPPFLHERLKPVHLTCRYSGWTTSSSWVPPIGIAVEVSKDKAKGGVTTDDNDDDDGNGNAASTL